MLDKELEEHQREQIENAHRAVERQQARGPWDVHRQHHEHGLQEVEAFLERFAARTTPNAVDFDLAVELQALLQIPDFKRVFEWGRSLGDRAGAFVSALAELRMSDDSGADHDARFRRFVIYLASTRCEVLEPFEEAFAELIGLEERRWIEMLQIAGAGSSKTLTLTRVSEVTCELRYSEGLRAKSCTITGENVEVLEQWGQNTNPARVLVACAQQETASDKRRNRERRLLQKRLRESLVKKLEDIGLAVAIEAIRKDKKVIGYEVRLPADVEVRFDSEKK